MKNNATVAKIMAVYGKRINENDYQALVSMKSVSDVAEYLKQNTYYSKVLSDVETVGIHRGFLESLLDKFHFETYRDWCKFEKVDQKQSFYRFYIVGNEINEILNALMHFNAERSQDYIISLPAFLITRASYDILALAKAHSFDDILEVLKKTPYHDLIKNVSVLDDGDVDFNSCENALRNYYTKWLLKEANKLKGRSDRTSLLNQIRGQVDLINLINAYRMAHYFKMSPVQIKKNLLDISGRFSKEIEKIILSATELDEYKRAIGNTVYGSRLNKYSNEYFEQSLRQLRYETTRHSLMFSETAEVSIYSGLYLIEVEIENLKAIIESIRYGKTPDFINSLLVK
ncbi:MAG: V-type ATPase subunit [Ruminococcus sp.]|jgi:V/A-type H+-transporting ATPase subunit C|nr:V-type ATPase subunit [Ruminococcus sp.]